MNSAKILKLKSENKMKQKKITVVETILQANRGNIDILNTQMHDRSVSCHGSSNSIKRGIAMLVLWTLPPFSEMMRSRNCFLHTSHMSPGEIELLEITLCIIYLILVIQKMSYWFHYREPMISTII